MLRDEPNKWEVWLADVRFEDKPEISKRRPVIVFDKQQVYIVSMKVTGQPPKNSKTDYVLQRWQEAGLDTVSIVQITKQLKLVRSDFICKIGKLQIKDIMEIKVRLMNL
ncbi:type II toxin-antitoxin system PemK/MazF family toxin [Phascolarctobacterium succinatutens]|uniref:type II toxin-antitoxin system PemK/MazF family toxin n=1 Tax=Phascolarctobacterium succinatutens TaxID=626940 RepID=UPI0026ED4B33|nr:type II toxin-antitoxin system PemK/MazF family toxin [Phascolarctobacterium succinatutens]